MNPDVIKKKLESLYKCLHRLKTVCPKTVEQLEQDITAQDVLVLNIQRSVQLCVDMASHILSDTAESSPTTMGATFLMLAQKKIITNECAHILVKTVGFRNIAVHEYDSVNMNIVFAVCTKHAKDFEDFAKHILFFLDTNDATKLSF